MEPNIVSWFCSWVCLNAIQLEPEARAWNVIHCDCRAGMDNKFAFEVKDNPNRHYLHKDKINGPSPGLHNIRHHRLWGKHQRHGKQGPELMSTPTNVSVTRGELAVLKCTVKNLGTKTVIWRKLPYKHPLTIGAYTFIEDPSLTVERSGQTQWNLLIKNVQPHHAGLYECQVSAQEKLIHIVQLRVKDSSSPNADSSDSTSSTHSDITLTGTAYVQNTEPIHLICNATNSVQSPRDITWYKDGEIITRGVLRRVIITRRQVSPRTLISELKIARSNTGDDGIYVCRTSDLEVTRFKVNVLNTYDIVRVRLEDPVKLICNITRKTEPPDDILWFKQGKPLSTDVSKKVYITNYRPRVTKTLISVFTVLKSNYSDTGLYICEEGNKEIKRFKVDVIPPYGYTPTTPGNVKRVPQERHQNTSNPNNINNNHYSNNDSHNSRTDRTESSASKIFSLLTVPALIFYTVWWNLAFS
ncbi:hemicentin-2 isoform X2 [Octopus sinensis]|uniref:Hemicentin-2 isoform X2 n=1 Tax=Octopus sinensis TaxID=2607531 RepID=A0A7E6F7N7_9MOLL|nr:hemicentin-2 isoform X2 [Octopus sinensis]